MMPGAVVHEYEILALRVRHWTLNALHVNGNTILIGCQRVLVSEEIDGMLSEIRRSEDGGVSTDGLVSDALIFYLVRRVFKAVYWTLRKSYFDFPPHPQTRNRSTDI